MPKKGRKRKKTRTHVVEDETTATALTSSSNAVPRSMVIRHGSSIKEEPELLDLVSDVRGLMSPNTAIKLKERKGAKLKDYADMSTVFNVTHLIAFSMNANGNVNCKVGRLQNGPTLTFKVKGFTLTKHVRAAQRRPVDTSQGIYKSSPIVVTNNFGGVDAKPHVKLMKITFQNMFPPIDVGTVVLSDIRRVVLFNFMGGDSEEVEVRHYALRANPTGVNRGIKKVVQAKIPNLSKIDDIADFVMGYGGAGAGGELSESEGEDETSHVVLPQKYVGKGNAQSQKSALKLVELGPRLRLKLNKVEKGLVSGEVMYHSTFKKTPEQVKEQRDKIAQRDALKKERRETQEANVARKEKLKEDKREAKRRRREENDEKIEEAVRGADDDNDSNPTSGSEDEDDSDGDGDRGNSDYDSNDGDSDEGDSSD